MNVCENPRCGARTSYPLRKGLCPNCYNYQRRTGRPRDPRRLWQTRSTQPRRLEIPDLPALAARYRAGEKVASLAAEAGCSVATLVRRFHQIGIRKQPRLSDEEVRRIRYRHFHGEESISQIAGSLDMPYNTVWGLVSGRSRLDAGGPLPASPQKGRRPCVRCGILTTSRLCHLCQADGHSPEKDYARYPA